MLEPACVKHQCRTALPACTQHLSLKHGVSHHRASSAPHAAHLCTKGATADVSAAGLYPLARHCLPPERCRLGRAWQCLARTSLDVPQARCYLPVSSSALPAIFFCLIMSTTTPQAQRASSCPTKPAPSWLASPFSAGRKSDPVQTALGLPDRHQHPAADCAAWQAEHAKLPCVAGSDAGWLAQPALGHVHWPSRLRSCALCGSCHSVCGVAPCRPSPLMCVWVATRCALVVDATSSILMLLLAADYTPEGTDLLVAQAVTICCAAVVQVLLMLLLLIHQGRPIARESCKQWHTMLPLVLFCNEAASSTKQLQAIWTSSRIWARSVRASV